MKELKISKTEKYVREHSDGCTLAPDFGFRSCCVNHDVAYSNIDSRTTPFHGNFKARRDADYALKNCIKNEIKGKSIFKKPLPYIYFGFVRAFGWLFYNYKNNS